MARSLVILLSMALLGAAVAQENATTAAPDATTAAPDATTAAPDATTAAPDATTAAPDATTAAPDATTAAPDATTAAPDATTATMLESYGLSVECTSEYMEAKLDIKKHTGLRLDNVALEDRKCTAYNIDENFAYFKTALDGCNTKHNTTADSIIYYNSIYADTSSGANNAKISRAMQAEFPFKCTYPRSALLSVVSFSPRRKVIYTRTSDFGNFTFFMDLYESDKFEDKYENYPVKVNLNEFLNVEVSVQSNDSKLALFAEECWATPSEDTEDSNKYQIIADGCKKDDTLVYDFQVNNPFQRFQVRAFRFIKGRSNDVYLHCRVEVCREGDKDSNCAKGCRSSSRRRRSLMSDASSETLTVGMIKFTQNANAQSATGNASSFTTVSIVAGVLGVLVVGLVVVLVIVYKKRQTPVNVVFKKVSGNDADQLMA